MSSSGLVVPPASSAVRLGKDTSNVPTSELLSSTWPAPSCRVPFQAVRAVRMAMGLRSLAITAESGFATGSSEEDAVRAGDLPHVAVGIGERAGVGIRALRLRAVIVHGDGAPCLVSGFEDDLGA